MAKLIECEDGFVVRGEDDEALVANAERHIAEAHPDLGKLSRDEILAMAKDELLSMAEQA
jgi:hypothetical protein